MQPFSAVLLQQTQYDHGNFVAFLFDASPTKWGTLSCVPPRRRALSNISGTECGVSRGAVATFLTSGNAMFYRGDVKT